MRRAFWAYMLSMLIFLIFLARTLPAADTLDTENQNFTFSLAGANENSLTALTAVQPLSSINGHAAIFIGRQTANDEVVSENIDVEVAGQYKFLEAFIEGKRDLHRDIEWESSIGYFLTPGKATVGAFTVTGGAGNSTNNTKVKETLGVENAGRVNLNWIGYLQVNVWKTETVLTVEPGIRLDNVEAEIESSIVHAVDENVSIGAKVLGHFASHPYGDSGKTHTQYLLFCRWTR